MFYEDCRFSWIFIIENCFWSIKFWILKKKNKQLYQTHGYEIKNLNLRPLDSLLGFSAAGSQGPHCEPSHFKTQTWHIPCMSYPFIPWHQYAYSPYCSLYISSGADKENFLNDQELLLFLITSSILVTVIQDPRMIL